jgi:PadR family transcriptional regulator, regulatory protein AphA
MSIKYAILGLLSWKPSTGYEIKKIFEESSIMYWSGNNNQIYKALVQLQDEGFVTNETKHQEGLPSKKIYTITSEGISELKEWICTSPEAPEFKKPFLVQLSWSDLLSNQELFELVAKYENEIKMQLILNQEKIKRRNFCPDRTQREKFLWDMINENLLSSYRNEMEWIKNLRSQLFEYKLIEEKKKMDYRIIQNEDKKFIELLTCISAISSEQDALDLVALCGEHETNYLMIHSDAISDDFLKLKTGVAGKVLQKFINYYIKMVAVIPNDRVMTAKFKDMVIETNRGNQFGVFSNKEEAVKWLLKD